MGNLKTKIDSTEADLVERRAAEVCRQLGIDPKKVQYTSTTTYQGYTAEIHCELREADLKIQLSQDDVVSLSLLASDWLDEAIFEALRPHAIKIVRLELGVRQVTCHYRELRPLLAALKAAVESDL